MKSMQIKIITRCVKSGEDVARADEIWGRLGEQAEHGMEIQKIQIRVRLQVIRVLSKSDNFIS